MLLIIPSSPSHLQQHQRTTTTTTTTATTTAATAIATAIAVISAMSSFILRTESQSAIWTSTDREPSFGQLVAQASTLLTLPLPSPSEQLSFRYRDADGDCVTVETDLDVRGAIQNALDTNNLGGNKEPLVTLEVQLTTKPLFRSHVSASNTSTTTTTTTTGTHTSNIANANRTPSGVSASQLPAMGDSCSHDQVMKVVASIQKTPEFHAAVQLLLPVVLKHVSTIEVADEFVMLETTTSK
jgi:hypothetical protein